MNPNRTYRPLSTCPHTYSVRVCSCPSFATEPCGPTACAGERPHLTAYPPPFRHTPFRPRPRHTATVWRNPGRHPHRDGTFTFSAKERDPETGYSYFGSRYYSSDLSVWLSVDPQAAKYPSLSPYVYCADNPVMLVDPNGEEIGDIFNIFGIQIGWDGKVDGKVYMYNTWSSRQLSLIEAAALTSSPRADVVNVTEKYGLYNYELNLRATLSMLKQAEAGPSNDPLTYNSWNSGYVFTTHSYSACPNDYQEHPGMNRNSNSSAAGAYQFLARYYTMPDFSPTSQDKAALKLMPSKGYEAAALGDIPSFVKECQKYWTSLKEWSIEELQSTFNAYRAMEMNGFSTIATPVGFICR